MSELDLLVIGDVNPDIILTGGDLEPRYGQPNIPIRGADLVVGGSAAITAMGAARLGLGVGVCSVVGDDVAGRLVRDELENAGVNTEHLRIDESTPTGMSIIFVRGEERAILTASGTISALAPAALDRLPDFPARHVHSSSFFLMNRSFRSALPAALARFRNAGATTSLDTGWDSAEEWDLDDVFRQLDLFLPNRAELRAVTRRGSIDDAMAVASDRGVDVAVKLGRKGGAILIDDEVFRVGAPDAAGFVDAVGAGDSFNAGYLTGFLTGANSAESIRLAVAAGTLSTRGHGGTATQATREEANHLAHQI